MSEAEKEYRAVILRGGEVKYKNFKSIIEAAGWLMENTRYPVKLSDMGGVKAVTLFRGVWWANFVDELLSVTELLVGTAPDNPNRPVSERCVYYNATSMGRYGYQSKSFDSIPAALNWLRENAYNPKAFNEEMNRNPVKFRDGVWRLSLNSELPGGEEVEIRRFAVEDLE